MTTKKRSLSVIFMDALMNYELLRKAISLYSSDTTNLDFFEKIISIGDLVDRGPKPLEVVHFLQQLQMQLLWATTRISTFV